MQPDRGHMAVKRPFLSCTDAWLTAANLRNADYTVKWISSGLPTIRPELATASGSRVVLAQLAGLADSQRIDQFAGVGDLIAG